MKLLFILFYLLFPILTFGQTNKYIGVYRNNNISEDTLSGYIFLSLDSFKIIYVINIKDNSDLLLPLANGKWTLLQKDGKDVGHLQFNDGRIKDITFGHFALSGELSGTFPDLILDNISYSGGLPSKRGSQLKKQSDF